MSVSHHPIDLLRQRQPHLFQSPDFWRSQWSDVVAQAAESSCEIIGRSAGGSEIPAFCYGELEPVTSTATISSAMASGRPGCFYDPQQRKKPSLALIGSIHGGETEGIAFCLNLIRLLETGRDWQGCAWSELKKTMEQFRLTIVPCLNPDGRQTAAVHHLNGAELEDLFLVQQGLLADGTPFQGRKVMETQPIPPGFLQFMGGYYNADGVNLQVDDFFGPGIAPENAAIQSLFRREIPDAFLSMHAHGASAAFLTPNAFLSPGYQRKQIEAAGFILSKLHGQQILFKTPGEIAVPPWSFSFQHWLHHMTGATPLLFEFCHGMKIHPAGLADILKTGFVVFEAWLDYCLRFGARPQSQEFFCDTTPA